jgi:hypothetical protein
MVGRPCCAVALLALILGAPPIVAAGEALPAEASGTTSAPAVDAVGPFRYGVFGNLGVFSALGFAGLSSAIAVRESLAIEAGVGYGLSGLQLSLMPKQRVGGRHHALVVGLGPSVGIGGGASVWLNGDIGYEYRARNGFSIGIAVGGTLGIAGCLEARCRSGGGSWGEDDDAKTVFSERARDYKGPQARLMVGKWFH